MEHLRTRVRNIVAGVLGAEPGALEDDSEANEMADWDSLRHLKIITAVEEEFGIEFSMDTIMEATSIAGLCDAVLALGADDVRN